MSKKEGIKDYFIIFITLLVFILVFIGLTVYWCKTHNNNYGRP